MPSVAPMSAAFKDARANATPNDALTRDCPGAAEAIARLWPRPHAPYFTADRPRRLLIAWLARAKDLKPADSEALSVWSLRRIAAHYAPAAPQGLTEAFKRAADRPWPIESIGLLVQLLKDGGEGQKTLRHAQVIHPEMVKCLAALPPALRRPRIVALLPHRRRAELVSRAIAHCWSNKAPQEWLRRLADRLERAPREQTLFDWLVNELGLAELAPPPVPAAPWLRPILSGPDIGRTALRFQNCLRTRIPWMLRGQAAYFEVVGDEPAVIELIAGNGAWRLGEVRGMANADVSGALQRQIVTYLMAHGAIQSRAKPPGIALELADAAGW
jgi:hypothetical protein